MYGLRKIRLYSWYHWQAVAGWQQIELEIGTMKIIVYLAICLVNHMPFRFCLEPTMTMLRPLSCYPEYGLEVVRFFKEIFNGPCLDSFYINSRLNSEMQSSFVFMWKQRISGVVEAAIYSCAVLKKPTVIRMCNFIEFQFHFQIKHLSPCLALNEHGRTKLRRKARSSRKLYPK